LSTGKIDKLNKLKFTTYKRFKIVSIKIINIINKYSKINIFNNISNSYTKLSKISYFEFRKNVENSLEKQKIFINIEYLNFLIEILFKDCETYIKYINKENSEMDKEEYKIINDKFKYQKQKIIELKQFTKFNNGIY
jgi:hypothetical protein